LPLLACFQCNCKVYLMKAPQVYYTEVSNIADKLQT